MRAPGTRPLREHVGTACCPEPLVSTARSPRHRIWDMSLPCGCRVSRFPETNQRASEDSPSRPCELAHRRMHCFGRPVPNHSGAHCLYCEHRHPPAPPHHVRPDRSDSHWRAARSEWNQQSSLWTFTQRIALMDTQMSLAETDLGAGPARYRRSDDGAFSTGRPLPGL